MGPHDSAVGNKGLYRLLQQHIAQREQQDSDSSEEESKTQSQDEEKLKKPTKTGRSEEIKGVPAGKHHGSRIQTKSNHTSQVKEMHMESADPEVLPQKLHKHKDTMKSCFRKGVKFTEKRFEDDIESFSSSEDEVHEEQVQLKGPSPRVNHSRHIFTTEHHNTKQRSVRFSGLKIQNTAKTSEFKKTQCRDEVNTGTIDTLLGITFHLIEVVGIL